MLRKLASVQLVATLLFVTGCGGGSGTSSIPNTSATQGADVQGVVLTTTGTINQPARSAQSLAPPNGQPVVTGKITDVQADHIEIQAGAGCGFLNVNRNGSTQYDLDGLSLAAGTYLQAWGTGSCGSGSVTASFVRLGSYVTVSGPISGTQPNLIEVKSQACGYIDATTTPSTSYTLNGQRPVAGTAATIVGFGSCSSYLSPATSVTLQAGSGPVKPPPATTTPSPRTTPTPTPATPGASNTYTGTANGQPWPSTFRPYSRYPWNNQLPVNPQNVDATNTAALGAYLQTTEVSFFASLSQDDYQHPVYLASNSDPIVTFNCGAAAYGCNQPFSSLQVPSKARPSGSADAHMGIIEPDGTEYDFFGASYNGGSSITATIGAVSSVLTSGIPTSKSATSGASLAAGVIRFSEISSGTIPHALFVSMPCTNNYRFPGTSQAYACADNAGIPVGAHLYLALTDAQIDALPASTVPAFERPILHAFHQYGAFVEDTGCAGSSTEATGWPCVVFESPTPYRAFGTTFPGDAFATANGYSLNPTGTWDRAGGINWPALRSSMKVLNSCYSTGACSN